MRPGRGYHVGCRAAPVLADLLYPCRWQINELVESLEEDAISPLALDDGTVTCAISSQKQGRVPLTLVVQDPGAYPRSPVLLLSDVALPCLDQLGEKLAAGCRLSRAIRLVGTMLGEWGWAQRAGSGHNRQASDAAGLAAPSCLCCALHAGEDLDWVEEAGGGEGSSDGEGGSDRDEEMEDADAQHSDEEDAEVLREWSRNLTRCGALLGARRGEGSRQRSAAAELTMHACAHADSWALPHPVHTYCSKHALLELTATPPARQVGSGGAAAGGQR